MTCVLFFQNMATYNSFSIFHVGLEVVPRELIGYCLLHYIYIIYILYIHIYILGFTHIVQAGIGPGMLLCGCEQ